MYINLPSLTVLYLVCSFIIAGMAALIWSRRPATGSISLTVFLLISAFWILTSGLEAAYAGTTMQDVWARVTYCVLVCSGVAWLNFALNYYGARWIRRPVFLALVCLIPLGVIVFTLTYPFPGEIWDEIAISFNAFKDADTVWLPKIVYLISTFLQYAFYLTGLVFLIILYRRKAAKYRPQITLLLIGTSIPLLGTLVEITMILPETRDDISPIYLLVGSILYAIAFIRFRFLDILPVAYRTLINKMPDGILVLDSEAVIQEMNPAAELILDQKRADAVNQPLAAVWPKLNHITLHTAEGKNTQFILGSSDEPRHLDVNWVVLCDDKQKVVGKLVALKDISELKATQRSLEQLFARERDLRQSLEEEISKRSQYSRAVVHELRNPLTSIIACTEMLEGQVKEDIQLSLVKNVYRSSVNLEQRVNELFELARGETGMIKIEPVEFDMAGLIHDITAEMSPVAHNKGITLRSACEGSELPVLGDVNRLRQVITNLVGNSLKFTQQGEIVIRAGCEDRQMKVQVEDNGRGIDAEEMKYLFDPYRRKTKGNRSTTGLGIGLALCKIFVELHQGTIWAESTPGKGTKINISLPLAPQSRQQEI